MRKSLRQSLRTDIIDKDLGLCRICKINIKKIVDLKSTLLPLECLEVYLSLSPINHALIAQLKSEISTILNRYFSSLPLDEPATIRSIILKLIEPHRHLEIEIDHIFPVCYGGEDVRENLRLLCSSCHKIESTKLTIFRQYARRTLGGGACSICKKPLQIRINSKDKIVSMDDVKKLFSKSRECFFLKCIHCE